MPTKQKHPKKPKLGDLQHVDNVTDQIHRTHGWEAKNEQIKAFATLLLDLTEHYTIDEIKQKIGL